MRQVQSSMLSISTSDSSQWMDVLDVPVDLMDRDRVEQWIRARLASGSACAHLVTVNPEYIMTARRDPEFSASLREADLATIDGAGLSVAVRLLEPDATAARVTGVDLAWMLARISSESTDGLFLLGAAPGIAAKAAERMREAYPGALIAGSWAEGSPEERDDEESIQRIAASGARVLLVAYGSPKQVHWIARNRNALSSAGIRLAIGVGGALDYVSGETPWAPPLVRRIGMEWAYRLLREPWRWRRQLVLPVFAGLVLRDVAKQRLDHFRKRLRAFYN